MSTKPISITEDPVAQYDAMVLSGQEISPEEFCKRFPNNLQLHRRIHALAELRRDLSRLVAQRPTRPRDIPGFTIAHQLGAGGMGVVYAARQHQPQRWCALKILPANSPVSLERFRREANLAARLQHPGIATVYAFGEYEDIAYIACELIAGMSLRSVLQVADRVGASTCELWLLRALETAVEHGQDTITPSASLPTEVALRIATDIAEALAHAHSHGVVHRDIKPANIMVSVVGNAKVVDFGIAKSLHDDAPGITQTGAFMGTLDYAAPEQLRGETHRIGPWTDTYALGATLYEMLSQHTPFVFEGASERIVSAHAVAPPVRTFNPQAPKWLEQLLVKALHPEPSERFQDGAEFLAALQARATTGTRVSVFPQRGRWGWMGTGLLGVLCAALAWIVYSAKSDLQGLEERFAAQRQQSAQAVFDARLQESAELLQECLQHEPTPPIAQKNPPRFESTVRVHRGKVVAVNVSSFTHGITGEGRACLRGALLALSLPGVGLHGEEEVFCDIVLRGE